MAGLRPGRPARGSRSGRPIMVILDSLGRRGALRLAWELRDEPLPFRELQRRCEFSSPNLLSRRLKEGCEIGTLEQDEDGRNALSADGRDLFEILRPLEAWANTWAGRSPTGGSGR